MKRAALWLLLLNGFAWAQEVDASNAYCIEYLPLPSNYPPLARNAFVQGEVQVIATVGAGGGLGVVNIQTAGLRFNLVRALIEDALLKARFRKDCQSKSVTLVFHFQLEEPRSDDGRISVVFGYPNRFTLRARQPLMHVD